MEDKHTPGPWKFNTAYDTIENDNGHVIVQFADWGWGNKGKLANAELIAQAPDLLAKVSEQEKEIAGLKEEIANLHLLPAYVVASRAVQKQVSEQSQRIQDLERYNDSAAKDLLEKAKKMAQLQEERKELEDKLRKQNVHIMNHLCDKTQLGDKVSEQSQRIAALTKENERLKERIDTDWYVLELRNDANRLLQERKDLVEALKEIHNLLDDGLEGSAQSKLESLLSKFEVPNQS